jgi:polynucleotide 5'-hydroxyl-kinase GRC3/NOL9
VALGEYGLSVIRGQITVLGAVLNASDTVHHVHALSSHSLPVIRYLSSDIEVAEIRLIQYNSGLRSLKYLSPLFGRLWNESATVLGTEGDNTRRSSFQIVCALFFIRVLANYRKLFSTKDGSRKMLVQPIQSPPEWNETFATFCSGKWTVENRSVAMICGPKSSGKSTYTKLLINRLLTTQTPLGQQFPGRGRKQRNDGVLLLDLDPGQPEYAPTGQLSLIHLSRPNFGPPYSHPDPKDEGLKIIRSHSICAISPSNDTGYYTTCVLDLLTHYRNFITSHPGSPLIINTPGWVQGTGLELLTDLIKQARPTVIIYTSIEGPADVVKALQEEAKKNRLITLPSQATEYTTRTAAQLRIMQAMSYFHSGPLKRNSPSWSATPLTSTPPWQVKYSGKNAGILGILCMGEQPLGDLIKDTINGVVLAVVVIDDMEAFPGLSDCNSSRDDGFDAANPPSEPSHISSIHRTKEENLPYLSATNATSLDPRYSHSIGLALVRGIDVEHQTLQLLTPISLHVLKDVQQCGKSIVLVGGRLETPGWAYTEELYKRAAAKKILDEEIGDEGSIDNIDDEPSGLLENGDAFEDAPWIEKLAGHEGRGAAARVWKVRRDLGRSSG